MLAIDSETTGIDTHHGAKPFLVTMCRDGEDPFHWQWDVDPLSREPQIPPDDVAKIIETIKAEPGPFVFQNAPFDFTALSKVGIDLAALGVWEKVHDTLTAGHLLASNQPHDLTTMVMQYLRVNSQPFEDRMKDAVTAARKIVKKRLPDWRIAVEGADDMPSVKQSSTRDEDKPWKNDCWLPRALLSWAYDNDRELFELHDDLSGSAEPWNTVTAEYADSDSFFTIKLWKRMEQELKRRGYWKVYLAKLAVLAPIQTMTSGGVTVSKKRMNEQRTKYATGSEAAGKRCVDIAASYHVAAPTTTATDGGRASLFDDERVPYGLKLPKSGNNGSLLTFAFEVMKLPVMGYTDTGKPAFDKESMVQWEGLLPEGGRELEFIRNLSGKRKQDTAVTYMDGYNRFGVPLVKKGIRLEDWIVLYPNVNPTGTGTLRLASYNPNEQNISKKEGFNLRYCFGPAPGREWWSFDAKNIERRLPAYEAQEQDIIELLERPDAPPYFGSEHALVGHLLFPKEFETCKNEQGDLDGRVFKKKYAATFYDKTKRFNFAVQYQCGVAKADATSGVPGSHKRFKSRFHKQEALNQKYVTFANRHGYVETLPDKSVDPERGYPIMCSRLTSGRVLPTVPLNYHVQGTACWWMIRAMTRVHAFLANLNAGKPFAGKTWPGGYRLTLNVHDELAADFPSGKTKAVAAPGCANGAPPWTYNLPVAQEIKRLMELGGDDLGVPLPVSVAFHEVSYAEEVQL